LAESAKRLIEDKIRALGVGDQFRVLHDRIIVPGNGVISFLGMVDHTAESVKSLENYGVAWIEEAALITERSLALLRPTIRAEGSEIWATWNPRRRSDAIDRFFRGEQKPENAVIVEANWLHNPFVPATLDEERRLDLRVYGDRYLHTWAGHYCTPFQGAYYALALAQAKQDGRVCELTPDPLLPIKLYWDLGGAGHKADSTAIWAVQSTGDRILCLDYLEFQGQTLGFVVNELRSRDYQNCECIIPHDGVVTSVLSGLRFEDHLRDAGFETTVIKNQGPGAAMQRIDAARKLFGKIWFDEKKTEAGRDALAWYHEKRCEQRDLQLGVEHHWSSHAADAFGLAMICYESPGSRANFNRRIEYPRIGII
jgi:phage terminase large subunit